MKQGDGSGVLLKHHETVNICFDKKMKRERKKEWRTIQTSQR